MRNCSQRATCTARAHLTHTVARDGLRSPPCFKKTAPAFWLGLMPTPSFVITALVAGDTLNCSATYLTHVKNGASSGTAMTLYGWLRSDARVNLKLIFALAAIAVCGGRARL